MKVRYTRPALVDLEEVLRYIAQESPQGARRVQARIRAVIRLLADHPYIGTATDDPPIRRMTTTPYPYLVFYHVADGAIIIHAIRHAARNPSDMPGAAPL